MAGIARWRASGGPIDRPPMLLRLYPAPWRARYGDEFAELLASRPPALRDRLDIVFGAIDARVHPQLNANDAQEIRSPGDRTIRGLTVLAGALLTAWATIGASQMRPWESGPLSTSSEALMNVAWVTGLAGAILIGVALLLIAIRYDASIGPSGAVGAVLLGSGLLFATFGGGVLALGMIGVGTALFSWRVRGRLLATAPTAILAATTAGLIAAFVAFAAGGGEDVRILWAIVAYGPAWMIVGLALRAPAPLPANA
jgi:hypothetical protein